MDYLFWSYKVTYKQTETLRPETCKTLSLEGWKIIFSEKSKWNIELHKFGVLA